MARRPQHPGLRLPGGFSDAKRCHAQQVRDRLEAASAQATEQLSQLLNVRHRLPDHPWPRWAEGGGDLLDHLLQDSPKNGGLIATQLSNVLAREKGQPAAEARDLVTSMYNDIKGKLDSTVATTIVNGRREMRAARGG